MISSCPSSTRSTSTRRWPIRSFTSSTARTCCRKSRPPKSRGRSSPSWRLEKTVKFHFFHLMPYPDLPDDFRQRYHGVWVDLPASELYDPVRGHEVYNEYLDELEYADQLGFDG